MSNNKSWQEQLDGFLAQNPPTADTRVLARALVDSEFENAREITELEQALNIEQNIDAIGLQPLPPGLQQKLQNIGKPARYENVIWTQFKTNWKKVSAIAATLATVTVLTSVNMTSLNSEEPTLAEIKQAEQELALAFHYISAARVKSAQKVQQTLDENVRLTINQNLFKQLNHIKESS